MLTININENNVVTGYCLGDGRVADGVEVDDIPSDFAPYKYKYIDGEYELNPDYVEPADEPENEDPTSEEILNVLLGVSE